MNNNSQQHTNQARRCRRVIQNIRRKCLPDAQRDVLRVLFNLHWRSKKSQDGCFCSPRDKVSKLASCSKKTVENALRRFREEGIVTVQRYSNGGSNPTVYQFSVERLMEVYGTSFKSQTGGEQ